jgi:hypothetical protein
MKTIITSILIIFSSLSIAGEAGNGGGPRIELNKMFNNDMINVEIENVREIEFNNGSYWTPYETLDVLSKEEKAGIFVDEKAIQIRNSLSTIKTIHLLY